MNSLNERKTASLEQCRFIIGKTGVEPTPKIQWHQPLSCGYNYHKGGLFNSLNMAYLRKKSMSCDFRLSSVEKKTLQKRRAITLFDQFRLLGNALWIQLKMTARRANWRLQTSHSSLRLFALLDKVLCLSKLSGPGWFRHVPYRALGFPSRQL